MSAAADLRVTGTPRVSEQWFPTEAQSGTPVRTTKARAEATNMISPTMNGMKCPSVRSVTSTVGWNAVFMNAVVMGSLLRQDRSEWFFLLLTDIHCPGPCGVDIAILLILWDFYLSDSELFLIPKRSKKVPQSTKNGSFFKGSNKI